MGSHSRLSPSGSKRYTLCPASVLRGEAYPEGPESPSAREGTRAHQLLETCLTEMKQPSKIPVLTDELGEWSPDAAMVQHIQDCIDYIGGQQIKMFPSDVLSEKQVDPEIITKCPEQKGTVDIQIISTHRRKLEIADLKYGQGIKVDPEDNTQLVLYAAGALAEHLEEGTATPFDEIICTIMQPRIPDPRGTNRSVTYTVEGLIEKAKEIGAAGNLALSGFGPAVPGEEQCRFCNARGDCAERREWVLQSSGVAFGPVDEKPPEELRDELLAAANTETEPSSLTNEALSSILDSIPALEAYIRDMKAEAQRRLERGQKIPGFKLVQGKRSRSWVKEEDDIRKWLKSAKVKVSDFEKKSLLGIAALRALVPEHKRDKFDELWEWSQGRPMVAHETDERPAIDTSAVTFNDVSE